MSETLTDAELVQRALAGTQEAFAALCERHRTRVWRIVASVARGGDVDDLAQEAIVRAWCALRSYRAEASFAAWLCRIALNAAHDYQKSAWKRRVVFWKDAPETEWLEAESPESQAEQRERQRRIRQAVGKLPVPQRIPIWLHYFEGFTLAEIARLEDMAESTVRSRVQAGLRKLAGSLEDLAETMDSGALPCAPERKGGYA